MIELSPEAEQQVDGLLAYYEALGRLEAVENLIDALARVSLRIENLPEAGLPAPRPYPSAQRFGVRWLKEGRYWVASRADDRPMILGVCHDTADIPNRL